VTHKPSGVATDFEGWLLKTGVKIGRNIDSRLIMAEYLHIKAPGLPFWGYNLHYILIMARGCGAEEAGFTRIFN
jgi:hypothetical protein